MSKINGQSMMALLDTGCSKSLVHPKCVQIKDYLDIRFPIKKMDLFSSCQCHPRVRGKEVEDSCGRI